jgi:histidine kinase/DNA gyrase B/HSP90-like ATPase
VKKNPAINNAEIKLLADSRFALDQHAVVVVTDLFEESGIPASKLKIELQSTSVSDAIAYDANTLRGAATANGIVLTTDIDNKLPPVCAGPARVRQILVILADNSNKFTQQNGTVKIQACIFEDDPAFLLLEVSDSGCEIDADKTEQILNESFELPIRMRPIKKGLDLGLYICKDLVMRQGGGIWAKSVQGQSSVVSVTLPICSLPALITPAFRDEKQTERSVTVIVPEIGSQTGWLSEQVRRFSAVASARSYAGVCTPIWIFSYPKWTLPDRKNSSVSRRLPTELVARPLVSGSGNDWTVPNVSGWQA